MRPIPTANLTEGRARRASARRLAHDVFSVADDTGARQFVVVGHSMGGKLAQYLPLVDPARVEALVLVASPPAGGLPTPAFAREWVELAGNARALIDATILPFNRQPVPERRSQSVR